MTIPGVITPPTVIAPLPPKPPARRAAGMGTEAPRLTIHYRCPVCGHDIAADAYDGPPVCMGTVEQGEHGKHRSWMVAVDVIDDKGDPLADIDAMTSGWFSKRQGDRRVSESETNSANDSR